MTDALSVTGSERGVVRLFHLDLPPAEIARLTTGAALARLVGLDEIDPEHAEVFAVSDLAGLGVAGYLTEGYDIAEADLASDRQKLDALDGQVLVLRSPAFGKRPTTLRPMPEVTFLGIYHEPAASVTFAPLPTESAKGVLGDAPQPTVKQASPHMTLMLALLALPTLALIIGVIVYGVMK